MFLFERCGPYLDIMKQKVKPDTIHMQQQKTEDGITLSVETKRVFNE
jgi:hypothetical protein